MKPEPDLSKVFGICPVCTGAPMLLDDDGNMRWHRTLGQPDCPGIGEPPSERYYRAKKGTYKKMDDEWIPAKRVSDARS